MEWLFSLGVVEHCRRCWGCFFFSATALTLKRALTIEESSFSGPGVAHLGGSCGISLSTANLGLAMLT